MPRTPEQKAKAAEAARRRYAADREGEAMRKLLARIKRQDYRPQLRTLEALGITLDEINKIREDYGLDPILSTTVRGRGVGIAKATREALAKERVDVDRVRASVIPTITVVRQSSSPPAPARTQVRVVTDADPRKTMVDIDYMRSAHAKNISNPKKLNDVIKNMTRVLTALGYKGTGSIVPFIRGFERFKTAIETLRRENGGEYALASRLAHIHPFSAVLKKETAPALIAQLPKKTSELIQTFYDSVNADVQQESADRLSNAQLPDWNRDVRGPVAKFIADTSNPLEQRALMAVMTQLGGVPRTGTFFDLHVAKSMAEASDENKNYVVLSRGQVTIVSNDHKRGVSRGRVAGKSITVYLDKRSKKWGDVEPAEIGKWIRELILADSSGLLFRFERSRKAFFGIISKIIPAIQKQHVNTLRKSYETWIQNNGDLELIKRATEVMAHTVSTARTKYAQRRA